MTEAPRRIAVIGTGTVGASWAAYFLARGFAVTASDPGPRAETVLHRRVAQAWPALEQLTAVPNASPERLIFTTEVAEALDGATWVQESAPEREDLKIELLATIDEHCASDVVIASSSSGLLMSRISVSMAHPERAVIGHPFNPPHLMPLVEVVGGEKTSPETVQSALEFYRSIGKRPIHVRREVVGHVANRIQAAILKEALHLLRSGVVSAPDFDDAVLYGPGIRWALMGPFMTFHLAGGEGGIKHFLEHLTEPYRTWIADLGSGNLTAEDAPGILAGVTEEVGGRPMEELVARRDAELVKLLSMIEQI